MNPALRLALYVNFCLNDPMRIGGTYAMRERFTSSVFISPEHNLLFVKNEKAGNNTARMTLQHAASPRPLPDGFRDRNRWLAPMLMPSDINLQSIDDLNRIPFKFAIVRNPYSRTLSAWLNKFAGNERKKAKFRKQLGLGGKGEVTFEQFVGAIGNQSPSEMDPHWRIQSVNIYCDLIRYDHFVKFEDYDNEFGAVVSRFFGKAPLRNMHKGDTGAGAKLVEHYTPAIADQVRRIYAADFETFGYPTQYGRALVG